jgi:hypothetical protein
VLVVESLKYTYSRYLIWSAYAVGADDYFGIAELELAKINLTQAVGA